MEKVEITENNEFVFDDVNLVPKNGKFFFKLVSAEDKEIEISQEQFKVLLVSASYSQNAYHNSFDYLLDQLEINEDLFTAMLYPKWIMK